MAFYKKNWFNPSANYLYNHRFSTNSESNWIISLSTKCKFYSKTFSSFKNVKSKTVYHTYQPHIGATLSKTCSQNLDSILYKVRGSSPFSNHPMCFQTFFHNKQLQKNAVADIFPHPFYYVYKGSSIFKPVFSAWSYRKFSVTNNIKLLHTDVTFLPQEDIKTQNFQNLDTLLDLVNSKLNDTSLPPEHVASTVCHLQTLVHEHLPLQHLSDDVRTRKQQIRFSSLARDKIEKYSSDPRWEKLMSFTEDRIDHIPLSDQALILQCLSLMSYSRSNKLFETCFQNCINNVNSLDLSDLIRLTNSVSTELERDFATQGLVVASVHSRLSSQPCESLTDAEMSKLCDILLSVQFAVGRDTLVLVASVLQVKLKEEEQTSVTVGTLLRCFQLMQVCHHEEILEMLPLNRLNQLQSDLNLAPLSSLEPTGVWPLPQLLARISHKWLAEINASSPSFPYLGYCVHLVPSQVLSAVVSQVDLVLLLQMIGQHITFDLLPLTTNREVVDIYYNRLTELFKTMEGTQLSELLSLQPSRVILFVSRLLRNENKLTQALTQQPTCDMSASLAEARLQQAVDTLNSNTLLPPSELSTLTSVTCRIDLDATLSLYEQLDAVIMMPDKSAAVKRQTQKLRATLQAQFYDTLDHLTILPPSLGSPCRDLQLLRHRSRPGLYGHLLGKLDRFVSLGRDRKWDNCLRALAVLDVTSEIWPLYQEGLYEDLTKFVISKCPTAVTPGVRLLKALASAGYTPNDVDLFSDWLVGFVNSLLQCSDLDKSILVQVASYMCDLCICYDDLICTIFSLDFLTGLNLEMQGKPASYRENITQSLIELSRSVAVECPHLSLPYLDFQTDATQRTSRQDFFNVQRVVSSLRRISGDDQCVVTAGRSPYGHYLDGLIVLDSNLAPVPISDSNALESFTDGYERLAFLYCREQNFCIGDGGHMTGSTQTNIRQLQILGYTVILLPHYKLSSLELHSDEALDDSIQDKINSAVGTQVF